MRLAVGPFPFDRPLHPADGGEIDTELMGEMAAHPDRRGLRVERQTDTLAFEIPGGTDACARVDENITMSEHTRRKYRQRHEPAIAAASEADEFRGRQF